MLKFTKQIDRIWLTVSEDGMSVHNYPHGCSLKVRDGWNDSCGWIQSTLSVSELRDLKYLCERAITAAEEQDRVS